LKPKKSNQTEPKPKKPSKTGKKTEQNRKKQSQTRKTKPNRFEPVFVLKNQIETGRFEPVSVQFRFFFKFSLVIFF
jgi:hypothetical protein